VGLISDDRAAAAALRVLERYKREQRAAVSPNVMVGAIPIAEGLEVRAQLTRWGGREMAQLRNCFRGRDGRWRPTKRGVTIPREQLEQLEAAVRALREAYAAGLIGPSAGSAGWPLMAMGRSKTEVAHALRVTNGRLASAGRASWPAAGPAGRATTGRSSPHHRRPRKNASWRARSSRFRPARPTGARTRGAGLSHGTHRSTRQRVGAIEGYLNHIRLDQDR